MDEGERLFTFKAGVLLPAFQAVLAGVFFSGMVWGACLLADEKQAGIYLIIGFSGVAFYIWLYLLLHWLRLASFVMGYQEQAQLEPPEPEQEPLYYPTVKIQLAENNSGYPRGEYIDVPATPEQLRLLACGVVSGGTLSENAWCGSNRPFTKAQFHQLRQALIERGWLAWRSGTAPAQGVVPTNVGRRVFSYLAQASIPPLEQVQGK